MPHEEALGLAQILLLLVALTLSLPLLTVAEEPIRHVFNRRVRRLPVLSLMAFTLTVVIGFVLASGKTALAVDKSARLLTAALVGIFTMLWANLLAKDSVRRLVDYVRGRLRAPLRRRKPIRDSDLADIVILGENLGGSEKATVISTIGEVCVGIQGSNYAGSGLDEAIDGLRRVTENARQPATEDDFRQTLSVIGGCWSTLRNLGLLSERDAGVLKDAACSLGETAVERSSDSVVLRCMVVIPEVVDLPYRIGAAALQRGRFRIAIAALNRLESIAIDEGYLSPGLMALAAYFCMAGDTAAEHGRALGRRLGYRNEDVRAAALKASNIFASTGDFAAADAVIRIWLPAP